MKLKSGYKKTYDKENMMLHVYPEDGRDHYYEKCWCCPVIDDKKHITHHNYSKANPEVEQCSKKE